LTGDDILEESPMRHLPRVNIPTVVAVGGDESAEFLRQSQDYVTAMRDAGLRSEYLAIPGRHHFDILDDLAEADGALWSALNGLLKTADEATAAA
jgi:arylformamidase